VLVFLTQGCLRRHFVRLEVSAAAKFGAQAIMVQETDPRHGSVPLSEHRDDCPESARAHLFGAQAHHALSPKRATKNPLPFFSRPLSVGKKNAAPRSKSQQRMQNAVNATRGAEEKSSVESDVYLSEIAAE
jgi:hypothetical protein